MLLNMPFWLVREEKYGCIPPPWDLLTKWAVVRELEDYCRTKICRPKRPLDFYEAKNQCEFHRDHVREPCPDRLIIKENRAILDYITAYILDRGSEGLGVINGQWDIHASRRGIDCRVRLVDVKVYPSGEAGQSVSVECGLRQGFDLSYCQFIFQNQTGEPSLRQRALLMVAELILAREPSLEEGGCDPVTADPVQRRLGFSNDPEVAAHIEGLGLPGNLKQDLVKQLCSVRSECSFYKRPDPQLHYRHPPLRDPEDVSSSDEEEEAPYVFLEEVSDRLRQVMNL